MTPVRDQLYRSLLINSVAPRTPGPSWGVGVLVVVACGYLIWWSG